MKTLPEVYRRGWASLNKMMHEGKSWSGSERNVCYLNIGTGPFADVSAVSGLDFTDDGRAVGIVDWDLDGALDLWLVNRTGPHVRFMRNVAKTDHHFLAVRLQGRTCNRDAIGARVELYVAGDGQRKFIRTLRAGEGFLAQSSKWLHFGLGTSTAIARLVVRWPDGPVEQFTGLAPDRRYRIVQGSGVAEVWTPPARTVRLEPSVLTAPPVSEAARIVLAGRIPMPPHLSYTDFKGTGIRLDPSPGPMLVNLWASWCAPCVTELSDFVENEQRLRASGLNIVALSVDEKADRPQAASLLRKLNWRFDAGFASPQLLDILDTLQRGLLDRKRRLPVPTSFLIDANQQLAVIYKGPVRPEVLLADVAKLNASPQAIYQAAIPFAGWWHQQPPAAAVSLLTLAEAYIDAGYPEIADGYLTRFVASGVPDSRELHGVLAIAQLNLGAVFVQQGKYKQAVPALRKALQLQPDLAEARNNLGAALQSIGAPDEAIHHYRQALQMEPDNALAHYNLGVALATQGKPDEAIPHYRQALRIKPDLAEAHYNLGYALFTQGKPDEAIGCFRQALQIKPDYAEAHSVLGAALEAQGNVDEAVHHFRQAVQLMPDHAEAHYNLGVALAAQGNPDEAVHHYRQAVLFDPEFVEARMTLGGLLAMTGRLDEALEHLREAVRLTPDRPAPLNGLAWVLATHPDAKVRDASQAIELTERAAELTSYRNATVLDTLAAAYAAAGRFDDAVRTAQNALDLALDTADSQAPDIRKRLELYKQQEPYREPVTP